jgi:hypothetical protein
MGVGGWVVLEMASSWALNYRGGDTRRLLFGKIDILMCMGRSFPFSCLFSLAPYDRINVEMERHESPQSYGPPELAPFLFYFILFFPGKCHRERNEFSVVPPFFIFGNSKKE